uniref:Uncharacterized protein n=1 Tax=Zea mays TaxID=4577 RepID=A0A804NGU7_MAIZE
MRSFLELLWRKSARSFLLFPPGRGAEEALRVAVRDVVSGEEGGGRHHKRQAGRGLHAAAHRAGVRGGFRPTAAPAHPVVAPGLRGGGVGRVLRPRARARPALVRRADAAAAAGSGSGQAVQLGRGRVHGRVDGDGGGGRRGRGAAGGGPRPAVAAVVAVRVVRVRRGGRADAVPRHPGLRLAGVVAGQPPVRAHRVRGHRRAGAPGHLRGGQGHLRAGHAGDRGAPAGARGARAAAAAAHGPLARRQPRGAGQPHAAGARRGDARRAAPGGHVRGAVRVLRREPRPGGPGRRRGARPVRGHAPRHRAQGLLVPLPGPRHRAAQAPQRRAPHPPVPQHAQGAVHAHGLHVHPAARQQRVAAAPVSPRGRGAVPARLGRRRPPWRRGAPAEGSGGQRAARVPQLAAPARDTERPVCLRRGGRHTPGPRVQQLLQGAQRAGQGAAAAPEATGGRVAAARRRAAAAVLVAGDRQHRHPRTVGRQQKGAGVRGIEFVRFVPLVCSLEQCTFFDSGSARGT